MSDNKFTLKNWNYCHYNSENFKALISIVATPGQDNEIIDLFCPTVLDHENQEVFQKDFKSLAKAIEFMNLTYSHWSFVDPMAKGEGCGSCNAH